MNFWFLPRQGVGDAIEAFAGKKDKEYNESHLTVMSCYQISNYVCRAARPAMKTLCHNTTLKIGKASNITPIDDNNIMLCKSGQSCKRRHIFNSHEDICLTVWKETLASFDRSALDTIEHPIVMAVTSTKVSTFAGTNPHFIYSQIAISIQPETTLRSLAQRQIEELTVRALFQI
ncbi:hypothetical protein L1987_05804 [Smallanthus sonchifolius]|uniref:Uncharacterized protein n=1 Tax=Smallanthus sonchifolius TaxID=185202 RepID=A0ACB9JWD7_9ASTR|nr:hypothetical protein L1987_05804 [Smallanthus sonchifolius]